jgi:hypothetical protein
MLPPTTTAVANVANLPNALTASKSSKFPPVQGSFLVQQALLDTAQRALLEPDDSVANVRHGLTLAGPFHGVKARVLAHWHVRTDDEGPG